MVFVTNVARISLAILSETIGYLPMVFVTTVARILPAILSDIVGYLELVIGLKDTTMLLCNTSVVTCQTVGC